MVPFGRSRIQRWPPRQRVLRRARFNEISHLQLTLAAVATGRPTTLHEVASWAVGDIVALDRSPTDPVDLRLNGGFVGRGHIVVDDVELSVRIGEIHDGRPERGR